MKLIFYDHSKSSGVKMKVYTMTKVKTRASFSGKCPSEDVSRVNNECDLRWRWCRPQHVAALMTSGVEWRQVWFFAILVRDIVPVVEQSQAALVIFWFVDPGGPIGVLWGSCQVNTLARATERCWHSVESCSLVSQCGALHYHADTRCLSAAAGWMVTLLVLKLHPCIFEHWGSHE